MYEASSSGLQENSNAIIKIRAWRLVQLPDDFSLPPIMNSLIILLTISLMTDCCRLRH